MTTKAKSHAERTHAILSASGSHRWLNCTPSARMEAALPREKDSEYALEGTLAHEIAETTLSYMTKGIDDKQYKKLLDVHSSNDSYYVGIIGDVQPYVDHVMEQLATDADAVLYLERSVDLSEFIPEGKGTVDTTVFANGILYINDLKFGKGVRVDAKQNTQLMLYAVGVLREFEMLYEVKTVRLTIVQPRLDHVSVWDIEPDELLNWAVNTVWPVAQIAWKGEGEHKTGDWCKFCKAKVQCPALKKEALTIAACDFTPDEIENEVDGEEALLLVYHAADRIKDYLDAVKAHIFQLALEGRKWPGLKLVEGKSNRRITNEKMVKQLLIKAGFKFNDFENNKLKGIGDLEKLIGSKEEFTKMLGPYIDKPRGQPTLADESDPRPEYSSANDFND